MPTIELLPGDDWARTTATGCGTCSTSRRGAGPVPLLDGGGAIRSAAGSPPDRGGGCLAERVPPSNGVMRTLLAAGYDCVPVNPNVRRCWAGPACRRSRRRSRDRPVDLVDVFRRPEATPDVARSAVAVGARVLWLQLGVVSWEAARIAHEAGLQVVMDRCTAIELRRVG